VAGPARSLEVLNSYLRIGINKVGNMFYGDDNLAVKWIQQEQYSNIVSLLVHEAIGKYRYAENLLNVDAEMRINLAGLFPFNFDCKGIHEAHELIAAYFRFKKYARGPLFQDDVDKADCINRWPEWASKEIDSLLQSPEFTRAVVLTVVEQNNEIVSVNEGIITNLLKTRYHEMLDVSPPKLVDC